MLKSELEPWCIVEFEEGTQWLRIGTTDALISSEGGYEEWNTLSEYNENLTYHDKFGDKDTYYDIVKVYNYCDYPNSHSYLIRNFLNHEYIDDKYKCVFDKNKENEDEKLEFTKEELVDFIRKEVDYYLQEN